MRCDECKVEPVTPNHFCECCGRKLSLQERKALDEKKAAQTSWGEPAPVLRKAPKGDRLVGIHFTPEPEPYVDEPGMNQRRSSIQSTSTHTSETSMPRGLSLTVPVTASATIDPILEAHFAGHAPVEAAPDAQVSAAPAVAPVVEPHVSADSPAAHSTAMCPRLAARAAADLPKSVICARGASRRFIRCSMRRPRPSRSRWLRHRRRLRRTTEVAPVVSAVPAEPEAAPVVSPIPAEPAQTVIAVRAPVAPVAPVVPVVEAAPAPQAPPQPVAAPSLPKSKPAPVAVAAVASSQDQPSRVRTIGAVIAVLVAVAAIGFPLSKLWFGGQGTAAIIRQDQPKPPVQQAAASPAEDAVAPAAVATSSAAETSASAPVQAAPKVPAAKVPPVAPKVSPAAASRTASAKVPPKSAKPNGSMRLANPVPAPAPVAAAPVPEVAPPPPVAAPEPKPEAPAAPIGQFFETRDVNEAPRIATKVEPQVPDDLRDRPLNEIVIVRVLVTQTGHAHIVNLLRRSKAGPSLDNAIVAAVKQWTFVPARKRGEAVSCWYHVGVPVNRAN